MSDRDSGSTDSRSEAIFGEGEYGMVHAEESHENIWASSNNTGVLEKTTEMAGGCRGGVDEVRHV